MARSKIPVPAFPKITRPDAREPVQRTRLFDWLDDHGGRRITWIAGPPGAGKTTLLGSYLDARGLGHVWYQVDPDDADLATFFYFLDLAFQRGSPRRRPLPILTPEHLPGFRVFARRFAENLAERIAAPAALVFDNYEQLPADAALHQAIVELAGNLPPGIRLHVLSRTEPPPAFARLRLHGDLAMLVPEALNLTEEEALALAAGRSGAASPPDAARVRRVLRETAGWPAGFTLLLAGCRDDAQGPVAVNGTRQLLFDYFAAESFNRLPAAVQSALMRTALLPVMSVPQAERMAADPAIGALLSELHRRNCFVVRRGESEPWYEYHELFRAFLLSRAEEAIAPDEWRRLQRRAADLLADTGQAEAAVQLYRVAEDWDGLAHLVVREAPTLIAAGRHRLLEEWLGDLPAEIFRHRPWADYWRGMARLPFGPVAARGHFERAYSEFKREDDAEGLYSAWSGIMDTFFYEWRDLRPVDPWIAEFEDLRTRHPVFPSLAVELRTYCAMGTLAHRQPQHPWLPAWAERALTLIGSGQTPELSILLGGYVVVCWLWWGDSGKAFDVVERLDVLTRAPGFPPMTAILWSCAAALYHSVHGDQAPCLEAVDHGLALAEQTGLHCWDFLLCAQAARCGLISGDLASADRWLAGMARNMQTYSPINGGFHNHLRTHAAAQRGDWSRAVDHARTALAMSCDAGVPYLEGHCRIDLARALLGSGGTREWRDHLATAHVLARDLGSRVLKYLCLELEADAAFQQGRERAGLQWLGDALALSRAMGGATWLLAGPKTSARRYDRALAAGIEAEHVRDLIRRRRLTPPDPLTAADDWPWPVHLYTLGRFCILVDGQSLPTARKPQHKPLELLKLLCTGGGQGIHEQRVTDALWPDAPGDAAARSLTVTLHRLRKLLHCEQAVRMEERRVVLDPNFVRVDSLVFDRIAHHPRRADRESLLYATRLYRGHFLEGDSTPWVLAFRARLHSQYRRMVERLGALFEQAEDWAGAIECYCAAIEIEPAAEVLYRRLMICHARCGQRAEALAAYRRCRTALLSQLGISPGHETQRIYAEVLGS